MLTRELEPRGCACARCSAASSARDGHGLAERGARRAASTSTSDGEAMRHVLRVASALDSMVVGEPQILGQTKDAYRAAVECGAAGPDPRPPVPARVRHRQARAQRDAHRRAARLGGARRGRARRARSSRTFAEQARAAGRRGRDGRARAARAARRRARVDRGGQPHRRARRAARGRSSAPPRTGSTSCRALLADADVVLTSIGGDASRWLTRRGRGARAARAPRPPDLRDRHRRAAQRRSRDRRARRRVPLRHRRPRARSRTRTPRSAAASRRAPRRSSTTEQQRFEGWFAALRAVPDDPRPARARRGDPRAASSRRALPRLALDDAGARGGRGAHARDREQDPARAALAPAPARPSARRAWRYLEVARLLFGLDEPDAGRPSRRAEPASRRPGARVSAVRIATRGSELALWQARYVARRIAAELGRETEIVPLTTTRRRAARRVAREASAARACS